MTLWHQGEVQGTWPKALPGWCWQGGSGLSFLGCGWWGELSTGSPSQWWSHRCCWWKRSLSTLPCLSRWRQVWRCPAFEDLSNKSLEAEQRPQWNDAKAVEIVRLATASYMHHASSSAPGSLLRRASVPNLSKPFLWMMQQNIMWPNRMRNLCCGLTLCKCITEQPSLQLGTCSGQHKRQGF